MFEIIFAGQSIFLQPILSILQSFLNGHSCLFRVTLDDETLIFIFIFFIKKAAIENSMYVFREMTMFSSHLLQSFVKEGFLMSVLD